MVFSIQGQVCEMPCQTFCIFCDSGGKYSDQGLSQREDVNFMFSVNDIKEYIFIDNNPFVSSDRSYKPGVKGDVEAQPC